MFSGRLERGRRPSLETAFCTLFFSLVLAGCELVVPAFRVMYEETGIPLPAPTELLVSIPSLAWLLLANASCFLLCAKDSFLDERWTERVNVAVLVATVGYVVGIAALLFLPLVGVVERL